MENRSPNLFYVDYDTVQGDGSMLSFLSSLAERNLLGEQNSKELSPEWAERVLSESVNIGVCVVDKDTGNIVGCLLGTIGYSWFNPNDTAFKEMLLMILPEYRGYSVFSELLRRVEFECKHFGIHKMVFGNAIRDNLPRYETLLKRKGFTIVSSYYKQLK